jgi:peptidoglycan/LPS O-acetylase OafA/YrhL
MRLAFLSVILTFGGFGFFLVAWKTKPQLCDGFYVSGFLVSAIALICWIEAFAGSD